MKFSRLFLISILSLCSELISFCGYDNAPECIYSDDDYDISIILKLPEDLSNACKDPYWAITDSKIITELAINLETQQEFESWCEREKYEFSNLQNVNYAGLKQLLCKYAFICYLANTKGYLFNWDFCKKSHLDMILSSILSRGSTSCFSGNSEVGEYLKNFSILIDSMQ